MSLIFKNVSKSFSNEAEPIKNMSFSLDKGRYALFGPSGRGKTTVLALAAGLIAPSSGQVERSGSLSYMFQEDRLLPWFSALKNVEIINKEQAKPLLLSLGLKDFLNARPRELSGGMQRKVALARALAKKSDIYLFDEPFTGLDQNTKKEVCSLLKKHLGENTLSIFVLHDERDAEYLELTPLRLF